MMASSLLCGRLCIIIAVIILLFLPLTFAANNNNNALAQPAEPSYCNVNLNYDPFWCIYYRFLIGHDICLEGLAISNNDWISRGHPEMVRDPSQACPPPNQPDHPPPGVEPQPQFQGPCAAWQTKWSDGSCVPSSCSTGQRNADGTCVPPPCPPVQPNVRDPRPRDVNRDLNDPPVNPEMRFHLENALRAARAAGFNVEVSEAYRSPERSQELYEQSVRTYEQRRANIMAQIEATEDPAERQRLNTQLQNLRRPAAAPAGSSAHNYGIAVDIRILDERGNPLEGRNPATGSHLYEQLVPIMEKEGFVWYGPNDNGHYEYHPNWAGREGGVVGGRFLMGERDRAIVEEVARNWALGGPWGFNLMPVDWLANMWNKAGAPCSP